MPSGEFTVEYTIGRKDKNGNPTEKEVSIVMKNYKGYDKKRLDLSRKSFNSLMECNNVSVWEVKCKGGICGSGNNQTLDISCEGNCKVTATGNYVTGGTTASNPVVLKFDSGESIKFDQAFTNVTVHGSSCNASDLAKFKI